MVSGSEGTAMSQSSIQPKSSAGWFNRFAMRSARVVGSPYAFLFAITSIILWFGSGPYFHWSNAWQLVVNSLTNVVTYMVVFVIQNSQNRDSEAIYLKLNELITANQAASNALLNVEDLSDSDIDALFRKYERIRKEWERRRK
jgi:low affinity Fe/Cu permease